ncbi:hypothetical protein NC652_034203 [Populus alba x Populus x berolinensis]|nr:hypothetical protein NC652_034203 [Populus alba x Populus x berolinensis]
MSIGSFCTPQELLVVIREDFLDIVKSVWESPIRGTPIYRFTAKLRLLKHSLKTLHRHHTSHISSRVAEAKQKWTSTQILLDESPASVDLLAAERYHAKLFSQLCKEEEAIYKQRSRIQWLQLGDRNTKFFHRSLMHRQSRNNIHALNDEAGIQRAPQFGWSGCILAFSEGGAFGISTLHQPPHGPGERFSSAELSAKIAVGKGSANGRERVGSPDMERVEVGSNVSCMVQLTALEFLPAWPCSREAPTKFSLFQHSGFKFCTLLFKVGDTSPRFCCCSEAKFFCFFAWGLSPRLAAVGMGPVAQET